MSYKYEAQIFIQTVWKLTLFSLTHLQAKTCWETRSKTFSKVDPAGLDLAFSASTTMLLLKSLFVKLWVLTPSSIAYLN